jgi:hypothetical protein
MTLKLDQVSILFINPLLGMLQKRVKKYSTLYEYKGNGILPQKEIPKKTDTKTKDGNSFVTGDNVEE